MAVGNVAGLWRWTADFSVRWARSILAVAVVATLALVPTVLRIETDTDMQSFFRPVSRELTHDIEVLFDEGGQLNLIFESRSDRSLLEPELLHKQLRIMQALKEKYRITTYSLVEGIDAGLERIKGKSLLDYDEYTPIAEAILGLAGGRTVRDLEKMSRHMISHPEAISFYAKLRIAYAMGVTMGGVGTRQTTYGIPYVKAIKAFARLDSDYSDDERRRILAEIPPLIQSIGEPELDVYALNDLLMSQELDQRSQQNALLLGLTAFLVDGLCLWLLFRNRRELLIVLTILGVACVWSFGTAELLGVRFSFFHLVALPILLGTGIDDTLVFGRRLAEERARGRQFRAALRATFQGVGNAISLTTFTTFLAFLISGLMAPTEIVRSFFFLVAHSMVIVFLVSTILQGAIRTELERWDRAAGRPNPSSPPSPLEGGTRFVTRGSHWMMQHRHAALVLSGLMILAAAISATQLRSEMRRGDMLRSGMQSYDANESLDAYFAESRVGYLVITGEIENPILLQKLKRLHQNLAGHPGIQQVLRAANVESIIDLMDKLRVSVTPQTSVRDEFDRIGQNERTANYVLDRSYREAAEYVVHKTGDRYDALLMRFFTNGGNTNNAIAAIDAIEEQLSALGFDQIPGIEIRLGGGDIAYSIEANYYVELLTNSFLLSLVANWIVLFLIWRRALLSFIALVPVVISVTLIVGAMGIFGIHLNYLTVAVGAIAVGLGIDYPIHLIERFLEERQEGLQTAAEATHSALVTMGPHILASALTTVVGFGAACVLALPMAVSFGLLVGAALALVYLASMFVLPVLLAGWDDRGHQSATGRVATTASRVPETE
jgi:predicted RND superfamily exporter protein